ncbi:DNA-binding protein [Novosphingobium sp. ERN07]|uniref:Zn-ribbon domain-containing OB-fold protein n=1 Tax=Novosphingobium sp. ERN07 TaxID=2726187 RepID=UPI001456E329|nr:OB-fold domain-containing protein [Novosphingobium sp. ERN07]NLR72989.1 DNA-binding protein [Novosphingobium sp. ERN07]
MSYSFEQHKIVGAIEADDPFWRSLEDGVLALPRCAGCHGWTWPAHHRCGQCGSWQFDWVPVKPEGYVFSYTRTRYAFDRVLERKDDVPYVTLVVELPEAGNVRLMGVLKGDETGLAIGARVRGSIDSPSAKTKFYPALRWEIEG